MKKRPWKKHARIDRIEYQSGDVKFQSVVSEAYRYYGDLAARQWKQRGEFESKTAAEADLDAWWADWWPKQIKSSRKV